MFLDYNYRMLSKIQLLTGVKGNSISVGPARKLLSVTRQSKDLKSFTWALTVNCFFRHLILYVYIFLIMMSTILNTSDVTSSKSQKSFIIKVYSSSFTFANSNKLC